MRQPNPLCTCTWLTSELHIHDSLFRRHCLHTLLLWEKHASCGSATAGHIHGCCGVVISRSEQCTPRGWHSRHLCWWAMAGVSSVSQCLCVWGCALGDFGFSDVACMRGLHMCAIFRRMRMCCQNTERADGQVGARDVGINCSHAVGGDATPVYVVCRITIIR